MMIGFIGISLITTALAGTSSPNAPDLPWVNSFDLGLGADDALVDVRRFDLGDGSLVKARRTHRGAVVLGEVASVRFDGAGNPLWVASGFLPITTSNEVMLSPAEGAASALAHLLQVDVDAATPAVGELASRLVVTAAPHRFAYLVHVPAAVPWWRRTVIVDAENGAVLAVRSPVQHAEALGNAYLPHPDSAASLNEPTEVEIRRLTVADPLVPAGEFVVSESCLVSDEDVRLITCSDIANGLACLSPDFADVLVAFCGQGHLAEARQLEELRYPPFDDISDYSDTARITDPFAEVHTYYHIDAVAEFMGALGLTTSAPIPTLSNITLPDGARIECATAAWSAVPEAQRDADEAREVWSECASAGAEQGPFDNAFFLGDDLEDLVDVSSGLYFGQGSVADFAYDGDIAYHEFGHAVEGAVGSLLGGPFFDAIGYNVEPGALAEAYGDYVAASLSGDPVIGGYVSGRLGEPQGIRYLDHDLVCPDYLSGEVHDDSWGFAGALWAARELYAETETDDVTGLTVRVFDRLVFQALVSLGPQSNVTQFAEAVIREVKQSEALGDPGAVRVTGVFEQRNVLDCERILTPPVDAMTLPAGGVSDGGGGGFGGGDSYTPYAPGPFQLRLGESCGEVFATRADARLSVDDPGGLFGDGEGDSASELSLVVSVGAPIEFTYSAGSTGTNVGTAAPTTLLPFPWDSEEERFEASFDFQTDEPLFLAVVNGGSAQRLGDVEFVPCTAAGGEGNGGGTGSGSGDGSNQGGCATVGWEPLLLALLLRRRRRRS